MSRDGVRRLAIVEYVRSAGGVERVLRGLAAAFLEIPEARGWEITFLLSRYNSAWVRTGWPEHLVRANVKVEWLGEHTALSRVLNPIAHGQGLFGLKATKLPALLGARVLWWLGPHRWRAHLGDPRALIADASRRFDVVYCHYPFGMHAPALSARLVTTPADFNFKHFAKDGVRRRLFDRKLQSWLARSDRLLMSSHAMDEELRQFYPEHASKAEVVHLGLDPHAAPSDGDVESFRRARGLPREFLLTAGWVMPHKNQHVLVEALSKLRERGRRVPIVFVGPNAAQLGDERHFVPGGYVGQVRRALREGGFEAGRDFFPLGYVGDAEVQCLYRLATAFVYPTLYEGFGLPSLEAMQAGCPAILAAIPPLLEQDRLLGGVARTFDPNDAGALADQIDWVLSHPDEARAAARLAAERVGEVYDWKKTARAYLRAFEAVLADSRDAAAAGPLRPAASR